MTTRQKFSLWLFSVVGNSKSSTGGFKYTKELYAGLVIALVIGAAGSGYHWYSHVQEQRAHKILADCMHEYDKAVSGVQDWSSVEQAFTLGYEKHSGSSLAPYFLAYKADVLIKQNKKDEAVVIFDTMAEQLSVSSPLYNPYMTKRALVKMDMTDELTRKVGLQELTTLANDTTNSHRDMALYYLGLYYWAAQDIKQAQGIWTNLVALQTESKESRSPWAVLVETKLLQTV